MTQTNANSQARVPGFWTRLMYALADVGESYEERLERRVSQLERQVQHLTAASQGRPGKGRS